MREPLIWPDFKSSWAQLLTEHLQDKRRHGFSYQREVYHLLQLDRLFESRGIDDIALTENIVNEWLSSTLHRSPSTHRKRVIAIRQLVKFMQRHVATDLPPKSEMVREVRLGETQAKLYESIRVSMQQRVRKALKAKGLAQSRVTVLDALLKLRQCCCHPELVKLSSARRVKESAKTNLAL